MVWWNQDGILTLKSLEEGLILKLQVEKVYITMFLHTCMYTAVFIHNFIDNNVSL